MKFGRASNTMRCAIFSTLLVFWLPAVSVVVYAGWMLTNLKFLITLIQYEKHYYAAFFIIYVLSTLLTIIAHGVINMVRRFQFTTSHRTLVLFVFCLLVMLIAEVLVITFQFHNTNELVDFVQLRLNLTVQKDYGEIPLRTQELDTIQEKLQCCGVDGPYDWQVNYDNKVNGNNGISSKVTDDNPMYQLPASCCKNGTEGNLCEDSRTARLAFPLKPAINRDGCAKKVVIAIEDFTKSIRFDVGLIIGLQLFLLILLWVLSYVIQLKDIFITIFMMMIFGSLLVPCVLVIFYVASVDHFGTSYYLKLKYFELL